MKIILSLVVILIAAVSLGKTNPKMEMKQDKNHNHQNHDHKKHKHEKGHKMNAGLKNLTPTNALVKVQGMVCAFCAQGIEKNFNKLEEVKSTKVDLDKMEVLIEFKKGKSIGEKKIKEVVTGAGFEYKGIIDAK